VAISPAQIVGELTVVTGNGLTVTVATAVPVQPAVVPVTVYVVVLAGVASAVLIPEELAPADHVYVVAPPADKLAVCPAQIVGELTVIDIAGATVTVATAEEVHPKDVPVTVYVVVVAGVASAVLTPVEVAPADHVYVVAPDAIRLAVNVGQIVGELTVVTGRGLTVTVATAVDVHPKEVPVTVYDVVVKGKSVIEFVTAPVDHE